MSVEYELTEEEKHLIAFLREMVDIEKGRASIKSRLDALVNPDNLQAMSVLSPMQIKFVVDSYWLAETYPIFACVKKYAYHLMKTSPSGKAERGGLGREQAIRFMGAITEGKLLKQLGVSLSGERKENKK